MEFEVGFSDDPKSIVKATQAAILVALEKILKQIEAEGGGPGITWPNLFALIEYLKEKEPLIYEGSEN